MAGETFSLDFTLPTKAGEESDTPLYPGYQVIHTPDGRGGDGFYQVRRVTLRIDSRDAARGITEETVLYPRKHATLEDAIAAAGAAFVADGPGDYGHDRALKAATEAAVAQHAPAAAPAAAPSAPSFVHPGF